MILVTGADGKTGRALIRALASGAEAIRGLVHRDEQVATVKASGAREVVVGDLREKAALRQATEGARAVYHICPNVHPDEAVIGQNVISAARAAGVDRFVYHSVLHPQIEAMPHHWNKMRVEEALFESGLLFTILQPTVYMQNISAQWASIVDRGLYVVPYSVETRLSLVDLDDVAEIARIVLTEPHHVGAIYELVGTEPTSQIEMAEILRQQLGRPVHADEQSIKSWKEEARSKGLGEYAVQTLVKMFRYYQRYGLGGNPRVLTWLLGRPPTSLATFVARKAGK